MSPRAVGGLDESVVWRPSANEREWADGVVAAVCVAVNAALAGHERAVLLLSGGATPAPALRALAQARLDWTRVIVSLVDERDVDAQAAGSNARLVRTTLLAGAAGAATFWPLREAGRSLADAVRACNQRWSDAVPRYTVAAALLGMGDDGHTASWFAGAADLARTLCSHDPYVEVDAHGCAGAREWPRRISLTPAGLALADTRLLLIRGAARRTVLERALSADPANAAPIRVAAEIAGARLQVHWCAT